MSDNKSAPLTVELITQCMKEVSKELGMMAADDPRLATALKEFSQLTQLRRAVKFAGTPVVELYMDELAPEMATLKPGDPRRAQIVHHIMRLSDLAKEI